MSIQLIPNEHNGAKIRVVGVGGGGGNIVNSMINKGIEGVEFVSINTDAQALEISKAEVKIQIGKNLTKGLGAGMRDEIGAKAVEENREEISKALAGSDMVFITAGMGGGTGTGGAPEVARIAKSHDALVVAIVTRPFKFEGKPKMDLADSGIQRLKEEVDSLIIIPNQKILDLVSDDCGDSQAFALANKVLYNATKGISQIITKAGEINVDFADVRTIMKESGDAIIGTGIAEGEGRAERAVDEALNNPVLDNIDIKGAKRVLINICSNSNRKISEINSINERIHTAVGDEAQYIFGIANDDELQDMIMVTVIATGFKSAEERKIEDKTQKSSSDFIEESRKTGTYNITSLPNSQKQLSDLDEPAYKRRDFLRQNVNEDLSDKPKTKKTPLNDDLNLDGMNFGGMNFDEMPNTPSFLRRQMD
jgi:cell division protein FtsZ